MADIIKIKTFGIYPEEIQKRLENNAIVLSEEMLMQIEEAVSKGNKETRRKAYLAVIENKLDFALIKQLLDIVTEVSIKALLNHESINKLLNEIKMLKIDLKSSLFEKEIFKTTEKKTFWV